jgi:N-acetylmuramoyl-L-alanine amidase
VVVVQTQASATLNRGREWALRRVVFSHANMFVSLRIAISKFPISRSAIFLALLGALFNLAAPRAAARVRHNDVWARQEFAKAERMREALNGRPVGERTRHEYQRVIDAYRRVYFGSPSSSKADPSVVATAELLVEMGRRFDDDKILGEAVDQYRFLRREYPGSKYRFDALFTIGEIYKDDLNDLEEARKTFQEFLHRYPRNRLAEDAQAAIKNIDDQELTARTRQGQGNRGGKQAGQNRDSEAASSGASASGAGSERQNALPRVTGVRHWSTPDYTRVAIDIEQEVKFSSQRIANPDRIFFDLRDTKLASTLVGKTFDVDDGFLKKVRVAEFKPGQTRVVLEVDDLSRYDAFLLPDPYRLIIDIHGKQSRATMLAKAQRASGGSDSSASASSSSESADEASDLTAPQKGPVKSEKEHAIVAKYDSPKVDSDDDSGDDGSSAEKLSRSIKDELKKEQSADSDGPGATSSGVVKTTTVVKGTRIPKTIVPADDDTSASAKSANAKKLKTSDSTWRGNSARDGSSDGSDGDATVAETKLAASDDGSTVTGVIEADRESSSTGASKSSTNSSPSNPSKSGPSRRKKTHPPSSSSSGAEAADLEAREAQPTAAGSRSLTRALGLKIGKIVIDPGHGGHDTGTIGPNGLEEKDLVLDVGKRLGRLLEARLGAEVIYTRKDDTFIPLETRTAIANREQADLFISIHANSSRDADARGVETYYLNFTSSPEALEVAARENAVSEASIHELQDLVKKIALKEKIDESREFASDVQDSLYGGLSLSNAGIRNRGVKKAPFIVLIGANMPSILAEISFVSNPTDERKLETSEQRQRIAESLYRGVARYAGGLSGVKVASRMEKSIAQ